VNASSSSGHFNDGSGIGTASSRFGTSLIDVIRLLESQVHAIAQSVVTDSNHLVYTGSGIRSGSYETGNSTIGGIDSMNSIVFASNSSTGRGGSGIGSGSGHFLNSSIGYIRINRSTVTAIGSSQDSGIGSGEIDSGHSIIEDIVISNSVITADGSSTCHSIGAPRYRRQVRSLTFIGPNFVNSESNISAPQINASSIVLLYASVTCVSTSMPLFNIPPMSAG
jgi:hypothetical protein